MVALAESDLITVWERVWSASCVEQALALLQLTSPGRSPEELATLPIGRRDGMLIRLREALFGCQLPMLVRCPECAAQIELDLSTDQLWLASPDSDDADRRTHKQDEFEIRYRLPDSRDLIAVSNVTGADERRHELLVRCVESAKGPTESVEFNDIPESVLDSLVRAMDEADPQANVEIQLCCMACNHEWSAPFDIVSYLWTEIDAWAQRTLNEVHLLASAYGWPEHDILSMSPSRRRLYVNMVRQ